MALSTEEKARNKAAQKVRDRAHTERARAMREAVRAAEAAPEVEEAHNAFRFADARMEVEIRARDDKERELREQIAKLQGQIEQLRISPELEALRADRRAKADAWQAVKRSKVVEAEAAFPDMAGAAQFSAAAWKPSAEVLAAMEAARAA